MSADAPNPNAPQPCPICSETRALSEHLIELALAANYLGNKSTYTGDHGTATIRTETIGDWFQLAAQLESVKINTWKFESPYAALHCETWADNIDDHSKHYTKHATALTRFIFVCNALEEAYRFIDHLYSPMAATKGIAKRQLKNSSSLRAVTLVDELFEKIGTAALPLHFEHHCGNFIALFNRYKTEHSATVGGINAGAEKLPTYALQLVRNLRNHVAHGTFPLGPPEDYGGYEDSEELVLMLRHACRVAALYIQIILRWFSPGFESWDYHSIQDAQSKEFDRFLEKCTLEYVLDLHLKSDFALHQDPYVCGEEDDDIEVVIHQPGSSQK
ncbi:TPA: hypothetical protein NJJ53_005034 [Pseudomonas aeruginosa]|uniref:hypothetical protein n=1 Tax=Pseudomonas aeruginosa TaxID=287 RepID=UPI00044BC023|nr:hypothetical protein [Pseudomonas aeruginosa]MDG0898875.1 hypothetical protein [Pseudomonas sp. L01]ETV01961.1 hypothetical protein Q052_02240 [Pseudomonas aeruginosa BWHPSA047]MBG7164137.1 hypothetical protein [Pseudomonas aeruginosa]MBH4430436.1 hypothetical protein [Pseudomonas aeruginosa]MBH4480182.1 hypothetical protein [Pseudomonas aeruginosa]